MHRAHLQHVLGEIDYLIEASAPLCRERFLGDETLRRAFARSLAVIGAASARLPDEIRREVPEWRETLALCERLQQDHFAVDHERVWEVVATRIPDLRARVVALLAAREGAAQIASNR